jgi:hypothetical protein
VIKTTEGGNIKVVASGWGGRRKWEVLFNGYKVKVTQDK